MDGVIRTKRVPWVGWLSFNMGGLNMGSLGKDSIEIMGHRKNSMAFLQTTIGRAQTHDFEVPNQ